MMEQEANEIRYLIARVRRQLAGPIVPFKSNYQIMTMADLLFRCWVNEGDCGDVVEARIRAALAKDLSKRFEARLKITSDRLHLVSLFRRYKLSRTERYVLLLAIFAALGVTEQAITIHGLMRLMSPDFRRVIAIARASSEEGRLARAGLIESDPGEPLALGLKASREVIAPFLGLRRSSGQRAIGTYSKLLDKCYVVCNALHERADLYDSARAIFGWLEGRTHQLAGHIRGLMHSLWRAADRHPQWPISRIRDLGDESPDVMMLLMLLGRELGFQAEAGAKLPGIVLARGASEDESAVRRCLQRLRRDRPLRREGYIKMSGGSSTGPMLENDMTLGSMEFELSPLLVKELLPRGRRIASAGKHRDVVRRPIIGWDQIVLPGRIERKLEMVVAQCREGQVLLKEWGIARTVPYGNGITVLFYGPPGTGKTATAEAIASRLGRPILAVNYSRIQDCWVGQTEKNVERVFREAAEAQAVLFWDEADAMFYNRDSSLRSFEVREVNVLLQQLEKFHGLCILATNRKVGLDPALERRITLKVEFAPPDRELRARIWKTLLPKEMPLAPDVSLFRLAALELSGGEIKNAVLNAARLALSERPAGPVTMEHFREAIQFETEGRWSRGRIQPIGFSPKGDDTLSGPRRKVRRRPTLVASSRGRHSPETRRRNFRGPETPRKST